MRRASCAAAVVAAIVLGACGGSDETPKPGLTAAQAHALAVPLDQARQSGAGRDLDGALAQLRTFRALVAKLRRAGALDAATAKRLRVGAARAEARARDELAPPPAQPAVTTPAPAPTEKKHGKRHDKQDKKHGKGEEGED